MAKTGAIHSCNSTYKHAIETPKSHPILDYSLMKLWKFPLFYSTKSPSIHGLEIT